MQAGGQLSLEYLLLLLAACSVFALLLPLLQQVYSLSSFALDCANAEHFSSLMQTQVSEMSFQANGSSAVIQAKPFGKWLVFSEENRLFVSVLGPEEKAFLVYFPNELEFEEILIEKQTSFVLRKENENLLLE